MTHKGKAVGSIDVHTDPSARFNHTNSMVIYTADFFFFQAEAGIRDLTVTGVQTCALPICKLLPLDPAETARAFQQMWIDAMHNPARAWANYSDFVQQYTQVMASTALKLWRSEERRVGKECRSRWSPYH